MPTKRPAPRHVLASNLAALMEQHKLTAPAVAQKAGVDRKTITNMLNGKYDPRPDKVDAVAKVFGLSGWQLLKQNLTISAAAADAPDPADADKLLDMFLEATPEQRRTILQVAEMATTYGKGK